MLTTIIISLRHHLLLFISSTLHSSRNNNNNNNEDFRECKLVWNVLRKPSSSALNEAWTSSSPRHHLRQTLWLAEQVELLPATTLLGQQKKKTKLTRMHAKLTASSSFPSPLKFTAISTTTASSLSPTWHAKSPSNCERTSSSRCFTQFLSSSHEAESWCWSTTTLRDAMWI